VLAEVMIIADLQTSATATIEMARVGFVVMSSRKMKTMDEGQIDRRRLVFLVEKEESISRKLLKG
jgi:hypothetical protein